MTTLLICGCVLVGAAVTAVVIGATILCSGRGLSDTPREWTRDWKDDA